MFRLNRHKQDKSGERIDFKFSSFQALQVPKGWDKLFVSIISVETGKTIAKSSKASVRDGTCQWTETLSESIWVSQVDTSKVIEDSFFKLVIAMGSARSGFLGEAAVNLTGYMSSRTSVPVLLPLKKCNHGTILQVKIQCLTPRTRPRDEQRKGLNSHVEDLTADYDDMDNKSDGSDNSFTRSIESSSSNHLSSTSHPGELDTSFSASGSRHSSDSVEGSIGRAKFSPTNNLNGDGYNLIGRQDSNGSQNGAPYGTYLFDDRPRSNHLSYNSRISGTGSHLQNQRQEFGKSSSHVIATSSLRNAGSSKDHLEAAEDTIEELRAEARMWERNARKLMLDLEILRKEFSDQSRNQANLDMELLAVYKERDGLKQELEQLKILLEESVVKQRATENSKFQARGMAHIQKELEDEIKFQQESNANLDLQLKKTQESNIELVSILQELEETIEKQKLELDSFSAQKSKFSDMEDEIKFQQESNANLGLQLKKSQESNIELVAILQELEETIEKQKLEIDSFSALKSKFSDMENYSHGNEYNWDLNSTKEDTSEKTRKTSADWEGSDVENTLQNFHEQLGAENNRNLALQLLNLKESQNNLQATVQYLEKALEEKKKEIKIEQNLKNQALLDIEAEWRRKLFAKEEEVFSLEAKLSHSLKARSAEEMGFVNGGDPNLVREIEASKAKIQELERDCNELTEENLELIFKLKESKKELLTGSTSFNFSSNVPPANMSTCTSESEVGKLKAHIYQLEQELRKKEIISEGVATDSLQFKLIDLETKCTDLELQLESCKDKACNLDAKHLESQVEEDKTVKIVALKQRLKFYQEKEIDRDEQLTVACTGFENSESHTSVEMGEIFSELFKELQMALAHVKKPWYNICSHVNTECEYYLDNLANLNSTDVTNQKEQAEAILNYLVGLNKLLEARVLECEDVLKSSEVEIRERDTNIAEYQKKLEDYKLKENTLHLSIQELDSLKMKLEANLSLKENEMEALRHFQGELEAQVSNLQKEKSHLEENMEIVLRESSINSKSLDGLRNDLIVLSSSVDFHVSANKTLERKSSELESGKGELELHLSELEEENIQLSERISGLEAQLRYLTDERESSRLELENSKSLAMNFRDEIRRLGLEMETQKVDLKQKLQDMQKRWSETQEECEFLKKANPKLEATAESLIEECSYLQKSNGELRKQKLELHERGMHLEAELKESQKSFSDCSKRVELLEAKLSSMREDIASKDKFLTSELDALLHENKEHKEKLLLVEGLLNQMYLEKVEVENLQREVAHLTEQLSATHGERERIASNAVFEVSNLRVDKAKLETALQEAQAKFKSSENKLYTLQTESGAKVQGLMGELAASIQNQELLMADREKLMRLLEDVKSSEEKFEGTVNGLELKLTASEYERQQLVEETASLKVQLQKIAHLQDKVLALKSLLNVTEFEKEKLEASLQVLSEDSEELKAERISFVEKISSMQKAVSELEDCRRTRVSLEEKLLRMEGDLTAREALCSQDAELKNELSRVKRANSQLQRKIQNLEEEKIECLERAQALEDELKLNKKEKHGRSQSSSNKFPGFSESTTDVIRIHEDLNLSENDMENNSNQHGKNRSEASMKTYKLQELSKSQQNLESEQYQKEDDSNYHMQNGCPQVTGIEPVSKIQLLESELADALEANNMYKIQLNRLLSEGENRDADVPKKLTSEGEAVKKEGYEHKTSSLEAELRDIRERYFEMSLRYAELEAQREELVMKLKSVNSGKRWFS